MASARPVDLRPAPRRTARRRAASAGSGTRRRRRGPSPAGRRRGRRRPPRRARPGAPESTTCPGALSLARLTPCRAASFAAWAGVPPSSASIVPPPPAAPASAISRPRRTTSSSAARSSSAPAAASAVISPSEWPATATGSTWPCRRVQPASDAQRIAGWAKAVDSSTRGNGSQPDELDARPRADRGARPRRARACPSTWEPCPGKTTAVAVAESTWSTVASAAPQVRGLPADRGADARGTDRGRVSSADRAAARAARPRRGCGPRACGRPRSCAP